MALGALDQEGICSGTWLVGMGILDPTGSRIAVLRRLVVVEQSGGQRGNCREMGEENKLTARSFKNHKICKRELENQMRSM